ncbi:MAG: hypothetical protein MUP85_07175 [Candidatus Lokiarchaeota archaeon]|nr:hypothetical protein [Candidatus Lokiarchaeota archaeon]
MLERTIIFDQCHNEMLNIEEDEFSNFYTLLKRLNLKIKKNEAEIITESVLQNSDILFIGNPIDNYFSNIEIKTICDYVRVGGSLVLVSEYGADYLQKTNLNDISGNQFGIFFEKNLIKEMKENDDQSSSMIKIENFVEHDITNGLRELIIGGTCSLFLNKDARPLLQTKKHDLWSEVFSKSKEQWIKEKEQQQILASYTEYGKGKVVALGDIDIFTNHSSIGIDSLDNHQFVQNIIEWLLKSVEEPNVMTFILSQMGNLINEVKDINTVVNNVIETMTILEKRLSFLEERFNVSSVSKKSENGHEFEKVEE